jgi:hypothetical protein
MNKSTCHQDFYVKNADSMKMTAFWDIESCSLTELTDTNNILFYYNIII